MDKSIVDLFLYDKPVKTILSLKDSEGKYASVIAKETDCTYTHTLKILDTLKSHGMVEFKKSGRIKNVVLTPIGYDIAHELEGLVRQFDRLIAEGKRSREKKKGKKSKKKSRKK